jgi:hypothetical protein
MIYLFFNLNMTFIAISNKPNLKSVKKMKQISKFFALAIVMIAFSASSFGQVFATANASATVIAPLTISATSELNFGSLAATAGGTVTVSTAGARTTTAGVTLAGGTVSAASYLISAYNGANITISLPSANITLANGGNTMVVGNFTSTIPAGNYTLTAVTATLSIGADLTVAAAQPAGVYTNNADLTVTVNYQ